MSHRKRGPVSPWWRHGLAAGVLLTGYTAAAVLFWFAPAPLVLLGVDHGDADTAPSTRIEASETDAEAQVEALAQAGRFGEAVRIAETAPAEARDTLRSAACSLWAIDDPVAAVRYVLGVDDPVRRGNLLKLVASAWASGPQAPEVVAFALGVPTETERRILLDAGLTAWVTRDVIGAATWLSRQPVRPELDAGFAAVAVNPDVLASQPDLAADWAARVSDADQRRAALAPALKALYRIDPAATDRRLSEGHALDRIETSHLREQLADI